MNWNCENRVYNMFTMNGFSPVNRYLAIAVVLLSNAVLAYLLLGNRVSVARAFTLSVASAAVFSYIYTPRMPLLVTPMLLLVIPRRFLPIVVAADVANECIMAFFFNRDLVVSALHYLGVAVAEPASPFNVRSAVQLFANVRNLLHAASITLAVEHGRRVTAKN